MPSVCSRNRPSVSSGTAPPSLPEQKTTNLATRVELINYKASYFMCDECCRDLGDRDHCPRAFAEPAQYGQCRHHSLAFQRTDVLCWAIRHVLHRTRPSCR